MEVPLTMHGGETREKLVQQRFHLAGCEVRLDRVEHLPQLVGNEVHHHVHVVDGVAYHHFLNAQNVGVVEILHD